MTEGDTDCMKSPNSKQNRMLEVDPNVEVPDIRKTSSDLMYCEYINTSGSERVNKLFENKKEKPAMVSYGESPIYKKYSDLLKKLEESKDVLPLECDEKLPIIEMEVFLKQNIDDDSGSDDAEDGRIIFCDGKDDTTTDEETSDDDDEHDTSLAKISNEVQIVSKKNKLSMEKGENSNSNRVKSSEEDCELDESCKSVSEKNDSLPNFEPVTKKFRLD